MKYILTCIAFCFLANLSQAAIPADTIVILQKIRKVTVEDGVIEIVAEKATTRTTLLAGDPDPAYKGETRDGKPVTTLQILSHDATFTVKQDHYSRSGGPLENAWKISLASARKLQEGAEIGTVEIEFYAPDILIKRHRVTSISGSGFLYAKRE